MGGSENLGDFLRYNRIISPNAFSRHVTRATT